MSFPHLTFSRTTTTEWEKSLSIKCTIRISEARNNPFVGRLYYNAASKNHRSSSSTEGHNSSKRSQRLPFCTYKLHIKHQTNDCICVCLQRYFVAVARCFSIHFIRVHLIQWSTSNGEFKPCWKLPNDLSL